MTRGPAVEYEIIWRSGWVEMLRAHQVWWTGGGLFESDSSPKRVHFHAEVNGEWRLLLSALEDDIIVIRNLTDAVDRP